MCCALEIRLLGILEIKLLRQDGLRSNMVMKSSRMIIGSPIPMPIPRAILPLVSMLAEAGISVDEGVITIVEVANAVKLEVREVECKLVDISVGEELAASESSPIEVTVVEDVLVRGGRVIPLEELGAIIRALTVSRLLGAIASLTSISRGDLLDQ